MKSDPFAGAVVPMRPRKSKLQDGYGKFVQEAAPKPPEPKAEKLYLCNYCEASLPRDSFYTHKGGRRYKKCKACVSKCNNARKERGDKPGLTGGKSYKSVFPPEQWGEVERFMDSFEGCVDEVVKAGVKGDVSAFLLEYQKRGVAE